MGKKDKIITVSIAALLLAGLAGCSGDATKGYTLASPYRKGVRTVAVDVFTRGRDIYRRDLEIQLTEAVIKRIELDTPYKVTTKARADTLLTGTITNISQRVMSFNPDTGSAREKEMIVVVSLKWTDLRDGEIIIEEPGLRSAGLYITADAFGEDFFQGSQVAIDGLAKRIVEKMEADW